VEGLRKVPGEVYPNPVRIVSVGPTVDQLLSNPSNSEWNQYSIEFCGGTHLPKTKPIQLFVVLDEEAVAKGVRRITAITGVQAANSLAKARQVEDAIRSFGTPGNNSTIADLLKRLEEEIPAWKKSELRDQIGALQNKQRQSAKTDLASLQKLAATYAEQTIQELKASP